MCSKHSVQWRSNIDEVVIFGAHTSNSLALSLPLYPPPSLPPSLTHLTSPQRNSTTQSLIHTLLHYLIHCHNSTHPRLLTWMFTHFITHPLTYSSTHSFAQKFARSLNYSHLHVITQSFTPPSPTRSSIPTNIHLITNLWKQTFSLSIVIMFITDGAW